LWAVPKPGILAAILGLISLVWLLAPSTGRKMGAEKIENCRKCSAQKLIFASLPTASLPTELSQISTEIAGF